MHSNEQSLVGVVYGTASMNEFRFAVRDPSVKRLDYVQAMTEDGELVLGRVLEVERKSTLSYDEALAIAEIRAAKRGPSSAAHVADENVTARVAIVGFRDARGLLQLPRVPLAAGAEVRKAAEQTIGAVLGLERDDAEGAYIGFLKGTELPVHLQINTLVQRHVCVLAKTGAGKSYTVGVLIEEMLKKRVPLVIIDPHNEYSTLTNPNIDPKEIDAMMRFGLKPKGFQRQVVNWATSANPQPAARLLRLEGTNLDPSDILALAGDQLTGAQVGVLYQAIKEAKEKKPIYTIKDIVTAAHANKSATKWNVINALEGLDSTGLFSTEAVAMTDLVKEGQCSIVSLKGVSPHLQEIVVARLADELFHARKAGKVPPFLLVLEEAHNWCPERGVGVAVCGPVVRTIASEGRKFGLGLVVVSQRPAKVDKNVVSQCNTQVILKVTNPNDLKAIVSSVEGLTPDAAEEIQRLPIGVALVSGGDLGVPILVEVRTRQSRHGGRSIAVVGPETEAEESTDVASQVEDERDDEPSLEEGHENPADHDESSEPERPIPVLVPSMTPGAVAEVEEEGPLPSAMPVRTSPVKAPPTRKLEDPLLLPDARQTVLPFNRSPPSPTLPSAIERPLAKVRTPDPPSPRIEADESAAHRVANRLGFLRTRDVDKAFDKLLTAAARVPGVSPDAYVKALARIGRTYCVPGIPRCDDGCPMAGKCAYKAQLDATASTKKGLLRRLFGAGGGRGLLRA